MRKIGKIMMNFCIKISLIVFLSVSVIGCNKVTEHVRELAKSKQPEAIVPPSPTVAAPLKWEDNHQAEIRQMEKQLCEDCGPESSVCEVEDYYEFPHTNKEVKRLIAFSEGGHGPNASYEVILSTNNACSSVLSESGTRLSFSPKANRNLFPDIDVSSHWSSEEWVETIYHWNGHEYVSTDSTHKNARKEMIPTRPVER